MKKLIFIPLMLFAVNAALFAQASATATATAVIVGPIGISNTANMNFGNVAVGATGGTVILEPSTTAGRTATGGVTLPATTGTVAAAAFTVTGVAGYTYAITLPSAALTISSGANSMTVDNWTSNPTPTGTLDGGGSQTLWVGATLHVSGSQAAGTYTSATPFTVTVNYN
ncbi:MAG TPA: DUF4402 domain-containing protein [Bacteroidales bacterium]|nr:DUF4402 domain-containing protein [Bacteroidales bacterium]HNR41530.1 DUF4402 domain-containing protein [Bacteroidales bacterium]HPM18676.1 DUF4402 domain-containing protein [Bacteroidales bacterium]